MSRKARITKVAFSADGDIQFHGTIWTDGEDITTSNVEVIFRKFRNEEISYRGAIDAVRASGGISGILSRFSKWRQRFEFSATVSVPFEDLPSSIYGFELRGSTGGTGIETSGSRSSLIVDDVRGLVLCAFVEPVVQVWRLEFYKLDSSKLQELHEYSKTRQDSQPLVVIGEYTNGARDNGRALHEAIECQDLGLQSRYIIEKENFDDYALKPDSVLEFGSMDHLKACLDSSVCAFTHHKSYVYPHILFHICRNRYRKVQTLFMQHGITAMKKSVARNYRKKRAGYDAVLVCSPMEKGIFVDHFGYDPAQVKVTGFPRHDSLVRQKDRQGNPAGDVLFFPTWRRGTDKIDRAGFETSEFFKHWKEAMHAVTKAGFQTTLVLHPMLARQEASFSPYVDRVAPLSEFQENLAASSCLVTDYSSVSFDALLMDKNVLLFQFDQEEFGLRRDAFIDVDTQLPGEFIPDIGALVDRLKEFRDSNWTFEQPEKRDLYFQYKDDQTSNRVADVVKDLSEVFIRRVGGKRLGKSM
jgi:CDP-glycerol glycerophosphotransferase (TagB/SpsB family)